MTRSVPTVTLDDLLGRYSALLLDAYGVLLSHDGPLPGAAALIRRLHDEEKPYLILTNDASRTPETSSRRYRTMGIDVPPDRILTSGVLLLPYFETAGLRGTRAAVLGPPDSARMVAEAGGEIVPLDGETDAETLVVCDEAGFHLLEGLDRALSLLYRRLDRGDRVHLVLANPDLVYPASPGRFGFTGGALALLLERALAVRYPDRDDLRFVPLGKPHPPMFAAAVERLGTRDAVMVGDQLATDILGAVRFGLDAALVATGLARFDALDGNVPCLPTYLLESLVAPPRR